MKYAVRRTNAFISAAAIAAIILLSGGCAPLSSIVSRKIESGHMVDHSRFEDNESHVSVPGGIARAEEITFNDRETLSTVQMSVIETAKKKLGCKYSYSAQGPDRFDCSGLMLYVFKQFGISLPHSSQAQYSAGRAVREDEPLRPGDLVFFSGSKVSKTVVGHVGMVIDYDGRTGEFTFIHAAMTGVEIQVSTAEYYAKRYIGARRIL